MKDWFAIFCGGLLGAMFAHSLGMFWVFGILAGSGIGYCVRMLEEPKRVKQAAKEVWREISGWRLPKDWKQRLMEILAMTTIGWTFCFWITFMVIAIHPGSGLSAFDYHAWVKFLLLQVSAIISSIFIAILSITTTPGPALTSLKSAKITALGNPISASILLALTISVASVVLLSLATVWTIYFVTCMPEIGGWCLRLVKTFFRHVHHSDFTSCAFWASVNAALVFFFVAPHPVAITLAAALGAGIGVALKRISERWAKRIQPQTT